MSAKTIFIIIFTAIITIFLMINTDAVEFNFIFAKSEVSKLLVIGVCTLVGFILGWWVGKPKTTVASYDSQIDPNQPGSDKRLSDEDRDYIS